MSRPAPSKKPKFIITNRVGLESSVVAISTVGFMEPYLQIAAYEKGYEVWALGFNTFQRKKDGEETCRVSQIKFENVDLLKIILSDLDIISRITEISEAQFRKKHDPKSNPLSVYRFNELLQNTDFVALMQKISKQHRVTFDKSSNFITEENKQDVRLEEFCAEGRNNVLYLRYANPKNLAPFKELERSGAILFPASTASFEFNDKRVVAETDVLRKYSSVTALIPTKDRSFDELVNEVVKFYNNNCSKEGLVIKPEHGGAGNGIVFVEAGYDLGHDNQAKLKERIAEEIGKSQSDHEAKYKKNVPYGGMILQKKVYSLVMDERKLPTGDVRVTIINGEIFGYAMRYGEEEDSALSYAPAKNILPNNQPFNKENIQHFIELNAPNQVVRQYYENLLYMYEIAQQTALWCKENKHFHVGADILIGRDSGGKYVTCLTELNNITPDGILKLMLLNKEVQALPELIDICGTVVRIITEGRCITKTPAKIMAASSAQKSDPTTSAHNFKG